MKYFFASIFFYVSYFVGASPEELINQGSDCAKEAVLMDLNERIVHLSCELEYQDKRHPKSDKYYFLLGARWYYLEAYSQLKSTFPY